jgi:hypothetical protein
VGRTTLFTPVDINLEQVVDFLNFYAYRKRSFSAGVGETVVTFSGAAILFWKILNLKCHFLYSGKIL